MKKTLFLFLLCFAFVIPFYPVGAQEAEAETEARAEPAAAAGSGSPSAQITHYQNKITGLISKIVGYISQIGAIFGQSTGMRIGGTTVSAIAMLVIAKLIEDKTPSWVRWILYATGGTMFAGSGANIAQTIMSALGV